MIAPRSRRRILLFASAIVLFYVYRFYALQPDLNPQYWSSSSPSTISRPSDEKTKGPYCPSLPGLEDILVVMKTGVTESQEKVPGHFNSTLACVPHYVIFSDFEEEIGGVPIHDAFRNMDPKVTRTVPDFDLYNRLVTHGRPGLALQDFADEANSALGKPNNPGWKLDKWKFLPMVQETLRHRADARWYVFIEADTYVSWPTLLAWLDTFDPSEPLYIGTETQIADVIFAHGGSGFVLSQPALQRAADAYRADPDALHRYTDGHWAGDCVLGKVLADVGVPLHYSWPILQNSNVGELDEFSPDFYRKPWCFPAVAFHHLSAADIQTLWAFEQNRWKSKTTPLLHSDIFKEFIFPRLSPPSRTNWDNLSGQPHPTINTFDACADFCAQNPSCVQFSLRDDRCFTSATPKLGSPHDSARSGWILDSIQKMIEMAGICPEPDFGH
ncbi:hypothetical protein ASPZODRAFT_153721 [Penicilliopsis zonata CBS 506.65]|uniref:N-acetylgalactosaminide beta-1,3-galactosyltransferase n=1 Tax=Penicilliopsis zonata CBS 506.65 TaxID=1073090 RepID=A0A1L9SAS3_9EURO|nr:hypothetical protein ASPZODRAFT_153721 [Penicilliopsis zonata CBS 506.65]OJJ44236.1 hypothetical protein ASPZODRAFT_153721 [Penicilliopsis zonata CBS 506.65]